MVQPRMESEIELAEVEEAIASLPTHKPLGPDDLSTEFCERFKTALNLLLLGIIFKKLAE